MVGTSSPPSLKVCPDRVEWVRVHEKRAISSGFGALFGGAFRMCVLCSLAGHLAALDAAGGAASSDASLSWGAVYLPYTMLLSLTLCCVCCCCACAPPIPSGGVGPSDRHGGDVPMSARRRVVGDPGHGRSASGSSDGTAPLLSGSSDGDNAGRSPGPGGASPHLL